MTLFKQFDGGDWDAFAGAEKFEDGGEPLVCYELKVDDLDAATILDANGIAIQVLTPDGEDVAYFYLDGTEAARWIALLGPSIALTTTELLDAGFREERVDR